MVRVASLFCVMGLVQVLGGYGYCDEYQVERLWRDAKLLEIGGGTLEAHHKNMVSLSFCCDRRRFRYEPSMPFDDAKSSVDTRTWSIRRKHMGMKGGPVSSDLPLYRQ